MNSFRIEPVAGRAAVLVSGGLDSAVLLAEMARRRREVFPLYVRTDLIWETHELAQLRRFIAALRLASIRPLTVLRLPMRDVAGEKWSTSGVGLPGYHAALSSNYILGRNLILLCKAAVFCARDRIGEIALALLSDNPFPDARPEFFRAFSRSVESGLGLKLQIALPFARLTKAQVIRRGARLPLSLTVSCIRPRGALHCGACTKCAERARAFALAGLPDPTRYSKGRAVARVR